MNRMLISTALLFGSALGFAQTDSVSIEKLIATGEIGRASCRERV